MKALLSMALAASFALSSALYAQNRTERLLEDGWRFSREVPENGELKFVTPAYDDSGWQQVSVPHDWAIYGPFSSRNDVHNVAIAQDGQTEAMEHAGRTGGLPFVGVGWYRLDFSVPEFGDGKKAYLIFDGAMSHAEVYVNGEKAYAWPYGYNSFYFDATPFIKAGEDNLLAVRLENLPESSRWYPGAGLYRNVHLVVTDEVHVPVWGTRVTTPVVEEGYAKVRVETSIDYPEGMKPSSLSITTAIVSPTGDVVATGEKVLTDYDGDTFSQELVVTDPELWSPDAPNLYKAVSRIYADGEQRDEYETTFGIRTFEVVPRGAKGRI